jgi:hypothetical protein
MKQSVFAPLVAAVLFACAATAQTKTNTPWLGVWHAELDGQPSVTLTLADDSGALGGTVVFNLVERQEQGEARVVSIQPHVLLHARVEATTLSFDVMRPDHSQAPLQFAVTLDGAERARIHCLNCGPDAAVGELVRAQ